MKTQPYKLESIDGDFDSSMLKVGEMMELTEGEKEKGGIVLLTAHYFILLNDPSCTWRLGSKMKGRKLSPGEGITLIQE